MLSPKCIWEKRYETTAMITGLTLNGETVSYRRKVVSVGKVQGDKTVS